MKDVLEVMMEMIHPMSILNGHIQCPNKNEKESQVKVIPIIQETKGISLIWRLIVLRYPTGYP
jgi:hypothetical protein